MSSLWTPDGERPIRRDPPASAPPAQSSPVGRGGEPSPEEMEAMEAELRAMTEEIASVPASAIVANHCVGLFQLAAAHLQMSPPNLDEARLAVDAMGLLVESLPGRLGPDEPTLIDALAQIRLAYVQVSGGA